MANSKYARIKRKPKISTADDRFSAPAMFSDNRYDTVCAAINSVDQKARQLEQHWGIGKLERLAAPKLAVAFEQARQNFQDACQGDDSNYLVQKANNLIEGWTALERSARKNGCSPNDPRVWEFYAPDDAGGQKYAIVDHASDTAAVNMDTHRVYSLDEVARIITSWEKTHLGEMTAETKKHFPNAKINQIKFDEEHNDTIPI